MKISGLKKAFGFQTAEDLTNYITTELTKSLVELQIALTRRLRFEDNFNSFEATVTIPAATEVSIQNQLSVVPTRRIIVRSNGIELVDGDTPWSREFVTLKNTGAAPITATVIFLE
jgi:hypothetical protein